MCRHALQVGLRPVGDHYPHIGTTKDPAHMRDNLTLGRPKRQKTLPVSSCLLEASAVDRNANGPEDQCEGDAHGGKGNGPLRRDGPEGAPASFAQYPATREGLASPGGPADH